MLSNGLNHFGSKQGQIPFASSLRKHVFPALFLLATSITFCPNAAMSQALKIVDKNGVLTPVWTDNKIESQPAPIESVKPQAVKDVQPLEAIPVEPEQSLKQVENSGSAKVATCSQKFSSRKQGQVLSISQGDYISRQLNDWARFHGYDLVWEADEFMAQGGVIFDGSFEEILEKFRESMDENGIGLDVSVYRNCVVRISTRK